jgi:hypothetical protein
VIEAGSSSFSKDGHGKVPKDEGTARAMFLLILLVPAAADFPNMN